MTRWIVSYLLAGVVVGVWFAIIEEKNYQEARRGSLSPLEVGTFALVWPITLLIGAVWLLGYCLRGFKR